MRASGVAASRVRASAGFDRADTRATFWFHRHFHAPHGLRSLRSRTPVVLLRSVWYAFFGSGAAMEVPSLY